VREDDDVLYDGRFGETNAGKVFFEGKDVTRVPMHKRARMGLGYLSQEPSVFRK